RGRLSSTLEIKRATVELPATFYVFDLLAFEDFDLRPLPLSERKQFLIDVVPKLGPVRALDHIEREGEAFLKSVTDMGLEGIIAKKADSPYRKGRSAQWLKIKSEKTADFVIVGFTEPKRSRGSFGALQLADYIDGDLVYAGRVGTGFNDSLLKELKSQLDTIVRDGPPCLGPCIAADAQPHPSEAIPETSTTTWVDPALVCQVRFREWTRDGILRHSAFQHMRPDKSPRECERQGWKKAEKTDNQDNPDLIRESAATPPPTVSLQPAPKTINFSNPKKIFWPAEGYTKGDLIEYYRAISPWLLPYLRNRPVVLTRFPDG
ncbi:MAG: hypothetical protein ABR582_17230, partial [Gemmatimonadaceae bacterium]